MPLQSKKVPPTVERWQFTGMKARYIVGKLRPIDPGMTGTLMGKLLWDFDMHALHAALDAERRARHLTWIELAAEINEPFRGISSLPISVTTIRNMLAKRSVTGTVVLQILRWLGRTPESFLSGRHVEPAASETLPVAGSSRILRFDTRALHAALSAERIRQGMTWKQVASEIPGFTEGMLTSLAAGPLIGFPRVMMITQWLGFPAASFVRDRSR